MRGRQRIVWLGVLALALPGVNASGEDAGSDDWRRFQDKEGNEIEARVVALSPDLRKVQILRRDGRSFDLPATRLSLDDQQHLRDWFLARQPEAPGRLRFDLVAEKRERSLAKERLQSALREAIWETTELSYDVRVTSMASAPVASLRLEYVLLLDDLVEVRARGQDSSDSDGPGNGPAPLWRSLPEGEMRYVRGQTDLPVLTFNRSHSVNVGALVMDSLKTAALERDESHDRAAGLLIRLLDAEGTVIQEHSDLARPHLSMTWDQLSARWDPREKGGTGILIQSMAAN